MVPIQNNMSAKTEERKLFVHFVKRRETDFELAGLSEDKLLWCECKVSIKILRITRYCCQDPLLKVL